MDRSLARGAPPTDPGPIADRADRAAVRVALVVVFVMLIVYVASDPVRINAYDHFVWQASAWLEGETAIRYPVVAADGLGGSNAHFQDVLPLRDAAGERTGRALIPFPPLPAVVLLPFVAVFGLATDAELVAAVLGALVVGLAYVVLGRLPVRPSVRLATTLLFGLGTVFWYTAQLGSTWYFAHVVAVGLTFLAIDVALGGDPLATAAAAHDDWEAQPPAPAGQEATETAGRGLGAPPGPGGPREPVTGGWWPLDGRQVLAGALLGLAATARLPIALGLPFLVLVGSGGGWRRRGLSAAVGAALPLVGLLVYNVVTTGHLFHPAYEYLYRQEIGFYPLLFPYLEYHADWLVEDPRYIPQNLRLMLAGLPEILPPCPSADDVRGWLDASCPYVRPRADGMSLLLASPALLLALPALRGWGKGRIVTGAALATLLIAVFDLMHFSQGWVQFGYRFSNDYLPFVLLLVALGMERLGGVRVGVALLIAVSIAVNLWGLAWSKLLGW